MGFEGKIFERLNNADSRDPASQFETARHPRTSNPHQHFAREFSNVTERVASHCCDSYPQSRQMGLTYRNLLLETLDRIGCGGVVLDANQNVIAMNSVAIEIVKHRTNRSAEDSNAESVGKQIRLLLHAMAWPCEEKDWVTTWQSTENPLAIIRVPTEEDIMLLLVDVGTRLQPSTEVLRRMFGLTSAESKLALGLASGSSPNDLAGKIGVRKTTIRTQLASVFSKTQTCRQGELVALLARVSILS